MIPGPPCMVTRVGSLLCEARARVTQFLWARQPLALASEGLWGPGALGLAISPAPSPNPAHLFISGPLLNSPQLPYLDVLSDSFIHSRTLTNAGCTCKSCSQGLTLLLWISAPSCGHVHGCPDQRGECRWAKGDGKI